MMLSKSVVGLRLRLSEINRRTQGQSSKWIILAILVHAGSARASVSVTLVRLLIQVDVEVNCLVAWTWMPPSLQTNVCMEGLLWSSLCAAGCGPWSRGCTSGKPNGSNWLSISLSKNPPSLFFYLGKTCRVLRCAHRLQQRIPLKLSSASACCHQQRWTLPLCSLVTGTRMMQRKWMNGGLWVYCHQKMVLFLLLNGGLSSQWQFQDPIKPYLG